MQLVKQYSSLQEIVLNPTRNTYLDLDLLEHFDAQSVSFQSVKAVFDEI